MDQPHLQQLLDDYRTAMTNENAIHDLEVYAGDPANAIVLLVHGIGGNARHWSDPIGLNVNDTWLFDLTQTPPANNTGIAPSPGYQPNNDASWTGYLKASNISYVNFSQARAGDLIEYAVKEATDLLTGLEQRVYPVLEQDAANNNGTVPPLMIVCHSRGGLVTRHALKQLDSAGLPHLKKVITLCTPHQGSYMPRLANDYNNLLSNQMDFKSLGSGLPGPLADIFHSSIDGFLTDIANQVRQSMLHSFGTMATSPGFDELIPNSTMLQNLQRDEQPLPGVQYFGYGGSNPVFVNVFFTVAGQAIRILETIGGILIGLFVQHIPGVEQNYGGIEELYRGDSAVSQLSSNWSPAFSAPHQDFHLNHMQALIDRPLQETVTGVITAAGSGGGW